jgi:flagellar biosynthesis/type III secretory pathway M-ring protein FliF/YscJ
VSLTVSYCLVSSFGPCEFNCQFQRLHLLLQASEITNNVIKKDEVVNTPVTKEGDESPEVSEKVSTTNAPHPAVMHTWQALLLWLLVLSVFLTLLPRMFKRRSKHDRRSE